MKRLVFDLDGTLTHDDPSVGYAERRPNLAVVEKLRAYSHTNGMTMGEIVSRALSAFLARTRRHG